MSACCFAVPRPGQEEEGWRLHQWHHPAGQGGSKEQIPVVPSEMTNSLRGESMMLSNEL